MNVKVNLQMIGAEIGTEKYLIDMIIGKDEGSGRTEPVWITTGDNTLFTLYRLLVFTFYTDLSHYSKISTYNGLGSFEIGQTSTEPFH